MYIPVKAPLALEFKYVVPTDFSRLLTSLVSIVYFADRNFYHICLFMNEVLFASPGSTDSALDSGVSYASNLLNNKPTAC